MLKQWIMRAMVLVTLVGGMLSAGGCTTDKAVIAQANAMNNELKPASMQDPVIQGYFQKVGDRIIASAKQLDQEGFGPGSHKKGDSEWMFGQDMQFHLVNSKTLNAFTTGGNHMYVYLELFEQCKSEDELAAVMAHEFGHVYARHVQKGMDRQLGVLGVAAAAGAVGYGASSDGNREENATYAAGAAAMVGQLVGMGFTRDDEAQADELGYYFYLYGGWDPDHFGDFFQHMVDQGYDTGSVMLSDHPSLASRVVKAKERASALPANVRQQLARPPVATPAEFASLQMRAAQIGKSMPTDEQLANTQQLLQALPRSCLTPVVEPDQIAAQKAIDAAAAKEKEKADAAVKAEAAKAEAAKETAPQAR